MAERRTLAGQGDMDSHDVLIVGSGLAGLRAAMGSVDRLGVAAVTKAYPSRSARFRTDFPARDDANWLQHTLAFCSADGGHALRYEPVTITRFEPEERNYQ
jgi:succinate dehydrogenase/fumarate reductase flavoprotein subunit